MIQTWLADVSALHKESVYQKYYQMVPAYRKEKADRLRNQEDKALSIGAWVLYQKMQKEYGLSENALFNLSHSGTFALCSVEDSGISEGKLGCDLEKIREIRKNVAKRAFCESEYQAILNDETLFYRYWVLKESFVKATRVGLKLGLNTFEIGFEEGKYPYLIRQPEAFPGKFYFKEYDMEKQTYRIAVCSDSSEFAPELKAVTLG